MLGQFLTLVQFRLLMLRRVWLRSTTGAVAGIVILLLGLMLTLLGLGVAVGLFVLGYAGVPDGGPLLLLVAVDGLVFLALVFWAVGTLSELQRSDVIDFRKMLYLPVSLRMIFLLNFGASLASPMLPVFALGLMGLTAGLVASQGPRMLLALPLGAVFYLMLAAWTYHFRGWLAVLMENKRLRRLILTIVPIVFVLISQLPNLLINSCQIGRQSRDLNTALKLSRQTQAEWQAALLERASLANAALPPGWLPLGLTAALQRRYGIAALCLVGMSGLTAWGLLAGYRSTYRHYTGAGRRRPAKRQSGPREPGRPRAPLTGRTLPGLAEDTSALAFANWLSAVRHPMVRMQLIMPFIVAAICMAPTLIRTASSGTFTPAPTLFGIVGFMVVASFAAFLFNIFGMDPEGFQALVLLPTPRRRYLLGKNLAFFPLVGGLFAVFAAIGLLVFRSEIGLVALSALQLLQVYVSLCLVGNFLSILLPFRVRRDAMNVGSARPRTFLTFIISLTVLPLLMLPSGIAFFIHATLGKASGGVPVGLVLAAGFLMVTLAAYAAALGPAGRLLEAREQRILADLRKDRE